MKTVQGNGARSIPAGVKAFSVAVLLGITVAVAGGVVGLSRPPQFRGFHAESGPEGTRWARHYVRLVWPMAWWRPLVADVSLRAPADASAGGLLVVVLEDDHPLMEVRLQPGQRAVVPIAVRTGVWTSGLNLQIKSDTVSGDVGAASRGVGVDGVTLRPAGVSRLTLALLLASGAAGAAVWLMVLRAWAAVLFPTAVFAWCSYGERTVVDDAFINFRIVDNFLAGNGPVFNIGQRVEAATSVLWLAFLAAARAATSPFDLSFESVSVVLGLMMGAGGMTLALWASIALWRDRDPPMRRLMLAPAGVAVLLAVAPFQEFTTSGLEMGLIMLWLATIVALLVVLETGRLPARLMPWAACLIGLGPLIRPDLGLVSVGFLCALCRRALAGGWRRTVWIGTAGLCIPAVVEVARAGYFATLVPNTALAKEGFSARWDQGWIYLLNFVSPYWLVIPVLVLLGATVVHLAGASSARRRVILIVFATAALHALYVVRLGGDFMHARMLLPSLFLFLTPVVLLPLPTTRKDRPGRIASTAATTIVLGWAAWCTGWSMPQQQPALIDPAGIAFEARFYRNLAGVARPVTLADYGGTAWAVTGAAYRTMAEDRPGHRPALKLGTGDLPLRQGLRSRLVVEAGAIGLVSYAAGPMVEIVDVLGKADAYAARVRLTGRGRPGHEKRLSTDWVVARYADPDALRASFEEIPERSAASRALACGRLVDLTAATTSPMTLNRFLKNLGLAWSLTVLRFDPVPSRAVVELCS